MVDEIFIGELKWYKLSDDKYILLRSKRIRHSETKI